jgi:hypothetical protein
LYPSSLEYEIISVSIIPLCLMIQGTRYKVGRYTST